MRAILRLSLWLCASAAAEAQVVDTTATRRDTVLTWEAAGAQPQLVIRSGERSAPGRVLARAIAGGHMVIDGRDRPVALPRGARIPVTAIVVAPRATVGADVQGDVIVVGGDLFLHPGARIAGDAIAIGGGVYRSTLASVGGQRLSFRDETFDAAREGRVIGLTHRVTRVEGETETVSWPFRVGVRFPSYNRIDGVVLPWGPFISFREGRFTVDPTVTYRSDLGALDPGVRAIADLRSLELTLDARRATFSSDKWIRGDFINSLTTLVAGRDTRNYYRADRIELTIGKRLTLGSVSLEPYVGAVDERGWTSGEELSAESHPWSLLGKDSINGIYRPNPAFLKNRISSGVAGVALSWRGEDVRVRATARYEQSWSSVLGATSCPLQVGVVCGPHFNQWTLDGGVGFATFGDQRLEVRSHAVLSAGQDDVPPRQRWVYLGGGGTLPTMDVLEQGGSELFFFESNYVIPVRLIELPFVGFPTVTLRYMTGGAGVNDLPRFTQNIGVRVGMRFIGIDYVVDPETKEKVFGIGVSLGL